MSAAGTLIATVVQVVAGPSGGADVEVVRRAVDDGARWMVDASSMARDERSSLEDRVRACGPENRCISSRFAQSGADYGVLVIANYAATPPLATVEVFVNGKGEPIAQELVELAEDRALVSLQRAVERALLAAGGAVGGRIALLTDPSDALVTVEPPVSVGRDRPALAPGPYVIHVARDGFTTTSTTVNVAARRLVETSVRLEPEPGLASKWWVWAAAGAVIVASVTVAVVVTRPDTEMVCHPVGGAGC